MIANSTREIPKATEGDKVISTVAMAITLVIFAMLFCTIMMGFAIYRFTAPVWPPAGMEKPSLLWPTMSTLIIVASSYVYYLFEKKINEGINQSKLLLVTLVLGLGFMVSQFIFWNELSSQGLFVSSGIYPSILYSFTWIHAAHIVVALLLLVWLYFSLRKADKMTTLKVSNVGKFWHFLGVVWLIMFVTIFVL